MNVAQNNTTAEHVAESDVLRQVSGGEWSLSKCDFLHHFNGVSTYHVAICKESDPMVADVYGRTPEEALANAKLMAAAKDMAEALRKGIEVFSGLSGQTHDEWSAVEKFRDALKKAGAA